MNTDRSFEVIHELLTILRRTKGETGRVQLRAHHWLSSADARDVGTRKKVIHAASPESGPKLGQYDGVLQIGETIEFVATSTRGGFVHLFDFGTSGTLFKLGPSLEHPNNRVEKDVEFTIPSPGTCPLPDGQTWQVSGPTTAVSGQPERLLVLVTDLDGGISIEDLHPQLKGRELYTRSAKGFPSRPGFVGRPRVDVPRLFQLSSDQFEYGLIELEVA
jgi:Domain of unknown function (DUF4384)